MHDNKLEENFERWEEWQAYQENLEYWRYPDSFDPIVHTIVVEDGGYYLIKFNPGNTKQIRQL